MNERDVRVLAVLAGGFPSLDTAVNIAFPAIDEHFDLGVVDLQWIVVSYLFTYAALLIPAGWLGDAIGHHRLVLIGAALSVVGVAGCAAAPNFGIFLAARVVQGVATAFLYAGSPALLTTTAGGAVGRGLAVSWFQAASMIGLTIGPIVGGPLVELAGWRAVYWFRVPFAIALVALAVRLTATQRPSDATRQKASRVGVRELLARPGFLRANLANSAANAAMFATWFLVPSLLLDELAVATVIGGLVLAASPAMSAAGSLWIGRRIDISDTRAMSRAGLITQAAGLALLAWAGPAESLAAIVAGMALVGAGLGVFSAPNMHLVMNSLPADRQGVAGALSVTMRSFGVVIGVLAAGAVFDPIDASHGFDRAFAVVFGVSSVVALAAAALSPATRSPAATETRVMRD